jgi:hypothetical protein
MKQLQQIQSESINELMGALAKAQGIMSGAAKDSSNPFFKSKYADLSSVWNACRESLSQHGLCVSQTMNMDEEGSMCIITTLAHSSGQWMRSYLPIKITPEPGKKINELQVLGSALTYLRRYALAAIVGVCPDEDDDGNAAVGYSTQKAPPPPRAPELPEMTEQEVRLWILEKEFENIDHDMYFLWIKSAIEEKNKTAPEEKKTNFRKFVEFIEKYPDKAADAFMKWNKQE